MTRCVQGLPEMGANPSEQRRNGIKEVEKKATRAAEQSRKENNPIVTTPAPKEHVYRGHPKTPPTVEVLQVQVNVNNAAGTTTTTTIVTYAPPEQEKMPTKKRSKPPPTKPVITEMMKRAGKNKVAGWDGKKWAVPGFGCDCCSMIQLEEYFINEKRFVDSHSQEGKLLDGTTCKRCNKPASELDWKKDRNMVSKAIIHLCNINLADQEKMEQGIYCPWWCYPCFEKDKADEAVERDKLEGGDGNTGGRPKRSRRG
jgi:hypothetical protein